MPDPCAFADPETVAELVVIADKVRDRLQRFRRMSRMIVVLFWIVGIGVAIVAGRAGNNSVSQGVAALALLSPLIAIALWQIKGERRIRRQVYLDEGVYCLNCNQTPDAAGDLTDWIAQRTCPHCGGKIQRYADG